MYQQETWQLNFLSCLMFLVDDLEKDCLGEKDNDFMFVAAAASIFASRNLNQILVCFKQMMVAYSLDEFKALLQRHELSQKKTLFTFMSTDMKPLERNNTF